MPKIEVINKNGENQILVNDIEVKEVKQLTSAGHYIAIGALLCLIPSFPDELSKINSKAKYGEIRGLANYRLGKYGDTRFKVDHMDIEIHAEIADEYLKDHELVAQRHIDHGCLWTRSMKKGIPINLHVKRHPSKQSEIK